MHRPNLIILAAMSACLLGPAVFAQGKPPYPDIADTSHAAPGVACEVSAISG